MNHVVVSTRGISGCFNRDMVLKDIKLLSHDGVTGDYVLVKHPDSFLPDVSDLCQVVESRAMDVDIYYMFGFHPLEKILELDSMNRGEGTCGRF